MTPCLPRADSRHLKRTETLKSRATTGPPFDPEPLAAVSDHRPCTGLHSRFAMTHHRHAIGEHHPEDSHGMPSDRPTGFRCLRATLCSSIGLPLRAAKTGSSEPVNFDCSLILARTHPKANGIGIFRRRLLAFTLPYSPRYHCARTAIVRGGSDSPSTVANCSLRLTLFH